MVIPKNINMRWRWKKGEIQKPVSDLCVYEIYWNATCVKCSPTTYMYIVHRLIAITKHSKQDATQRGNVQKALWTCCKPSSQSDFHFILCLQMQFEIKVNKFVRKKSNHCSAMLIVCYGIRMVKH